MHGSGASWDVGAAVACDCVHWESARSGASAGSRVLLWQELPNVCLLPLAFEEIVCRCGLRLCLCVLRSSRTPLDYWAVRGAGRIDETRAADLLLCRAASRTRSGGSALSAPTSSSSRGPASRKRSAVDVETKLRDVAETCRISRSMRAPTPTHYGQPRKPLARHRSPGSRQGRRRRYGEQAVLASVDPHDLHYADCRGAPRIGMPDSLGSG